MTSRPRYVREGIIGGLLGATLVAVWFLIYDAARGRPFRTPALLGAATFQGVTDPSTVPVAPHLVAQYTVLHGVVFALIGYGTKAGLAPMHTWKPDAYREAPSPAVVLMAVGMLNGALYCILRIHLISKASLGLSSRRGFC